VIALLAGRRFSETFGLVESQMPGIAGDELAASGVRGARRRRGLAEPVLPRGAGPRRCAGTGRGRRALSTFLHCRKARAVSTKKAALRSVTATLSRSTVRATSRAVPASPRVTASPAQAGPTPRLQCQTQT
jgi:hypothetical protein